jgi:nitroreductase
MIILLAAVDEGLGACFVAAFHDREVQQVLGLPPAVCPIGIIPVGYCSEGPRKFARRSKARIVHHNLYGSE